MYIIKTVRGPYLYIVKTKTCILDIKLTWMVWADRLGRDTTRQGCVSG